MSVSTLVLAHLSNLGPAEFGVRATCNIDVPAAGGISLRTDVFFPRGGGPFPALLMRVPYGRHGFDTIARIYAERGFITVLQACRGTGGSGGEFNPLTHEREDGLATLDWIKAQDWFDGRLGTTGPSYLGYAQWAICDALPAGAAMATKVTSAEFESVVLPGGAFHLQLWISWMQLIEGLRGLPIDISARIITGDIERRTSDAAAKLPLIDADFAVTGHKVAFWRNWLDTALDDTELWSSIDHTKRLGPETPPNFFVSGWYDFMIDQLLRDYQTLRAAGHTPWLTIGSWFHVHPDLQAESIRATLAWMRAHLKGDRSGLRAKPVRIHISGLGEWREFDSFPPPGGTSATLYLTAGGRLDKKPGKNAPPARYRYDPADPTPNLGGAVLAFSNVGARDNKKLEARADVLTFTGPQLPEPLTLIGQPKVILYARSSLEHADFFARLCDVAPNGRSTNICDALVRVSPGQPAPGPDGVRRLEITLHNNAHQFRPGHRLRLQISSGAHPRFARNLGTAEPIGTATKMIAADQCIFHGQTHPSALTLPLFEV